MDLESWRFATAVLGKGKTREGHPWKRRHAPGWFQSTESSVLPGSDELDELFLRTVNPRGE